MMSVTVFSAPVCSSVAISSALSIYSFRGTLAMDRSGLRIEPVETQPRCQPRAVGYPKTLSPGHTGAFFFDVVEGGRCRHTHRLRVWRSHAFVVRRAASAVTSTPGQSRGLFITRNGAQLGAVSRARCVPRARQVEAKGVYEPTLRIPDRGYPILSEQISAFAHS
jgi:hypothetical protein